MGMRASVVYRMKNGTVKVATLQWSRMLDKTFIDNIESSVLYNHFDNRAEAARSFIRNATSVNGHYSSIESMTAQQVNEMRRSTNDSRKRIRKIGPLSYGIFYDDYSPEVYKEITDSEIRRRCYYSLNSGAVGVYYDDANPNWVSFFRLNDDTNDVNFTNYPLI